MTSTADPAGLADARAAALPVQAPALILLALVLTCASPLWLLLVAPLLLGVPHLLGDLRYLILQRPGGLRTGHAIAILAPLLVMTLAHAVTLSGAEGWPRVEIGCGVAAVLAGALAGSSASPSRSAVGLAVAGLGLIACADPAITTLLLAHTHNLIGFGLFLAWARSRQEARWALGAYALAALALAFGLPVRQETAATTLTWSGMTQSLAPGLAGAVADRVVLAYAFAQAVHYAVWLWLIPRSRAGSSRTLRGDFGRLGLLAGAAAALLVPALALRGPAQVRSVYLSLAQFHGWLELSVLAFLWLRRRGA